MISTSQSPLSLHSNFAERLYVVSDEKVPNHQTHNPMTVEQWRLKVRKSKNKQVNTASVERFFRRLFSMEGQVWDASCLCPKIQYQRNKTLTLAPDAESLFYIGRAAWCNSERKCKSAPKVDISLILTVGTQTSGIPDDVRNRYVF